MTQGSKCRHYYLVCILAGMLSLVACDVSPPEPSDEEIKLFFSKHVSELEGLIAFCEQNPEVRWFGAEMGQIDIVKLIPENPDMAARAKAWGMMDRLGLRSLVCARDWGADNTPLIAVSFSIWAVGIAVSGRGKGLTYLFEVRPYVDGYIASGEYRALGKEGWYITSS